MSLDPGTSVVHLAMRKGRTPLSVGSGVLYERNGKFYVATAWHNLSGRHSETLRPISPTGGLPDNVVVSIGLTIKGPTGEGIIRLPFTVRLETDDGTDYLVHPVGWPRVDVAVMPIDPDREYDMEMHTAGGQVYDTKMPMRRFTEDLVSYDVEAIQKCAGAYARTGVPPDSLIDAGADLFVLGYPLGITDVTGSPIWKRATVASNPHLGWNKLPQFLIDCASRNGMSGGPVIALSRDGIVRVGMEKFVGEAPAAALHGIYVGRLPDEDVKDEDRLFMAQIGTVWKAAVVDEIIDAGVHGLHSCEVIAPNALIEAAVKAQWPADPEHARRVLASPDYGWGTAGAVLKEINGRASAKTVYKAVVAHAQQLQPANNDATGGAPS